MFTLNEIIVSLFISDCGEFGKVPRQQNWNLRTSQQSITVNGI